MNRSALNHALLSRLLVGLLVAGLAVQWMTNAVGMENGRGGPANIITAVSLGDALDQTLLDIAQSICSKSRANNGQTRAAHCQHCIPATTQFLTAPTSEIASPLALTAIPIGALSRSQILPPSRRLPGDGPSRAPPHLA